MAQAPMAQRSTAATTAADRTLRAAAVIFVVAFLLHNADHLRRGTGGLSSAVLGAGTFAAIAAVTVTVLIAIRHQLAPVAATVVGFATAVGVTASHLLPHWSAFSDAFPGSNVDGLSWAAVIVEIGAALVLGLAGLNALRRRA
jgi:hypothetical protein